MSEPARALAGGGSFFALGGERWLIGIGMVAFFGAGYFLIGHVVDPSTAHSFRTPLDDRIPFVAASIFPYSFVYIAALFPLFVVRCPRLLRRVAGAYMASIAIAFVCFVAYPVTSLDLRPDSTSLPPGGFTGWGLRTLYALDPPLNLFPSLHLAMALLAALAARSAGAVYGGIPFWVVGGIALSTVTVKQHFLVDGLAGLVLAGATHALVVARHDNTRQAGELRYTWRGPALYLLFAAGVYLGLFLAFRARFEPWA